MPETNSANESTPTSSAASESSSVESPDLSRSVTAALQREYRRRPQHTNRASSLGDACERRLAYDRTQWEQAITPSSWLLGIFHTGHELEGPVARLLERAGLESDPQWRIVGSQVSLTHPLLRAAQISGTGDGICQVKHDGAWKNYAAIDVKCLELNVMNRFRSVEDLNLFHWSQKYYAQVSLYAYGLEITKCMLVMVAKTNLGVVRVLEWDLDRQYVEGTLISKANRINWHLDRGTLPDKINSPVHCTACPYAHICQPVLESPGAYTLNDAEVEELCQIREANADAHAQFEHANERLKKILPEGPMVIAGDWLIEGTLRSRRAFNVKASEFWVRTFTKLGAKKEEEA